ncbi:helix-turn-helix transcriptional regulator [Solwaraspora sp. WMMD406]|uniref:helix-turn-helix domain-containing protein n=1 Tax=Solwaraspora sp. WMMD406 TaxID=3016095 RepID=UPI0024168C56|nr:helix-turn-helix transcriptional regulator [Solwaraspora sp. WMMD406]MDG4764116.1 helix-turn-helix transcriptional regulator [Solwaraspora sp. WMMD406]
MSMNNDPEVQRRRLRIALREFRQARQLTQKEVALELDWSTSKLIRIETGESSISVSDLRALLAHYEVSDADHIDRLVEMAKIAKRQTWATYRDIMSPALLQYLGYESSASRIRQFQPLLVPGLLQTEEYANAIIRTYSPPSLSSDDVERLVRARLERQELLSRDEAPMLYCIMDEAAVRRAVGRPGVMFRQLEWLKVLNERPNIHIQVIRFDAGEYRGLTRPFTILDFPNPADDDLVHLEGGRDETISAQEEVANYIDLFFQLEDLATPKARLNEVIDELIVHHAGPSRPKVTTG